MKLISYLYEEKQAAGVLSPDGRTVYPAKALGFSCGTMNEWIDLLAEEGIPALRKAVEAGCGKGIPVEEIILLAPIPEPKQDLICLGINYMAHAEESARFAKRDFNGERPHAVYFSKRVSEAARPGGVIDGHFDMVEQLDYEAELAVVIGKDARNVSAENAADYIFGYTIVNDVSARVIQRRHSQWYFGKSLDGFTPIGPWIVTADEFSFPPKLSIQSKVNGELRQDSNTELLIFGIDHIIEELSRGMTLKAGTIISTGTPSGVGMGFDPPRFLKAGDTVECIVEGIGILRNTVKA